MANHALAFDALGHATRRAIFERLARRPTSVARLADRFDVSRPAISQHLRVLKDGGLVLYRQEGTRRIYSVDTRGIQAMRAYLDRFWDDALAAFAAYAEADEENEK